MSMTRPRKALIGAAIAAVVGGFAGSAAQAVDTRVAIDNFTFSPKELRVVVGTTVTWTNRDDIPHTVVDAPAFRSKALDTDQTFSFTFRTPGRYHYFCSLHPHMTGVIVVDAATEGDAAQ